MQTVNHPWHGVHYGENSPSTVNAIIEIPQGSRAKYEVDKATGLLMIHWTYWFYVPNPFNHFAWLKQILLGICR